MTDIVAFVQSLGRLHDCTVVAIRWEPASQILTMDIDDIYFDFEGFPEYPGPQPGVFTFSGVTMAKFEVSMAESGRVLNDYKVLSEFEIHRDAGGYSSKIIFWSGQALEIRSADVTCDQSLLPTISLSE